ncbi:MAG: GIY-YIG nuclease family protein, partial [Bacteroidota bacterium]
MTTEDFKAMADSIPKQPGVYRFIDKEETIIYVGKAKVLRNRTSSYFGSKKNMAYKTRTMVKNAARLEYTVVESEADALLLENTLIKRFQPRYNVMLKDAKSYTYLCVKNERFPRVFFTRKVYKDGSKYYGPYTSKWKMNQIFEIIKNILPLRTCKLNLTEQNINAGKFKVCLEYHMKNCEGPCVNLETEQAYNEKIAQVRNILNGNFKPVKDFIKEEMARYAEELKFEEAAAMKEKLGLFEEYQAKSTVVSQTIRDVDVFTIDTDDDSAYVNYLKVVNGALINTDTRELQKNLDSEVEDLLAYAIPIIRDTVKFFADD